MVRWRKAAADGSVWVADPEPDYHLSVWQASSGCIGWDWQVLDRTGNVLARDWGVQAADDAQGQGGGLVSRPARPGGQAAPV